MKILMFFLIAMFLATAVFAGDGDITSTKVKEDGELLIPDTAVIHFITKQADILYRWVDAEGKYVEDAPNVILQDRADDPETLEDETDTSFTDFLALLKDFKKVTKEIVKNKLEIVEP